MCRNIRTLYNFQPEATDEEIDPALVSQEKSGISFCEPNAVFFLLLLCTEIKVEKQNEDYQVKLLQ